MDLKEKWNVTDNSKLFDKATSFYNEIHVKIVKKLNNHMKAIFEICIRVFTMYFQA